MGARRRRLNKEKLGIFGLYGGSTADDEESGGGGKATRRARSNGETQIGGIPWVVWVAWAVVALVVYFIFKYQHLLE